MALTLMAVGAFIEETGTIRRIRIGIGLRLLAVGVLISSVIWGAVPGGPTAGLTRIGWFFFVLAAPGIGVALRRDLGAFMDPRHGQVVRLEKLNADGLQFRAGSEPITLRASDVLRLSLADGPEGRGVVILVRERRRLQGDVNALAWVGSTREGDAFLVTEHQAGLDAELFAQKILEARDAAQGGYRQ